MADVAQAIGGHGDGTTRTMRSLLQSNMEIEMQVRSDQYCIWRQLETPSLAQGEFRYDKVTPSL